MIGRAISPPGHGGLADLESFVRRRQVSDGTLALWASRNDGRRCLRLRRMHKRLRGDSRLLVGLTDQDDGRLVLTIAPAGTAVVAFVGYPVD